MAFCWPRNSTLNASRLGTQPLSTVTRSTSEICNRPPLACGFRKAEAIHILDATDTDPTQVEDLVLNLREARDSSALRD